MIYFGISGFIPDLNFYVSWVGPLGWLAFGFTTTRDILLRGVLQGYDYLSIRFSIGKNFSRLFVPRRLLYLLHILQSS